MRQYELIERVKQYNPEDQRGSAQPRLCLCHAGAWRAEAGLGRPLFLAPLAGGRDPDRPEARRRHHRGGAAARHDRGYRRHPRRDRSPVRPRHRPSGRRADQAEEARTGVPGGQAGREPAQAPARHRRRRARAAGQARRPAAQHAHAGYRPPEARRRTAEETLDIYAPLAGRMGMQEMREELEDLAFRELNPEAYKVITERLEALAERSRGWIAEIEQQLTKKARRSRHHRRGRRPAQARLFDLAQDGAQGGRLRAAFRHPRLPRHRRKPSPSATRRSASSIPAGRSCRGDSRITSRRPSRTITARSTPR